MKNKRKYSQEQKLMNNCPNCGQEVNCKFVESVIDEIVADTQTQTAKEIVWIAIDLVDRYHVSTSYKEYKYTGILNIIQFKQVLEDRIEELRRIKRKRVIIN